MRPISPLGLREIQATIGHCSEPKDRKSIIPCRNRATVHKRFRRDLLNARPHPTLGQRGQSRGIRLHRLLVLLALRPSGLPLVENPGEQHRRWLVATPLSPSVLSLGWHESPLHGRLEHTRPRPPEVRLDPLQHGHGSVETGELFLDLGDDPMLLGEWGNSNRSRFEISSRDPRLTRRCTDSRLNMPTSFSGVDSKFDISWQDPPNAHTDELVWIDEVAVSVAYHRGHPNQR